MPFSDVERLIRQCHRKAWEKTSWSNHNRSV